MTNKITLLFLTIIYATMLAISVIGCSAPNKTESHDIDDLMSGKFHFKPEYLENLKNNQKPKVLVIGCSDSRVDPALLTGSLPGDIFVIRNIANLIPPYDLEKIRNGGTGAALEYAVNILQVSHIVVLGHSNCGGIKALINRTKSTPTGEFIDPWLDIAEKLKQEMIKLESEYSKEELLHQTEIVSLKQSAENLLTYPWIKKRVEENNLKIHPWYFDISKRKLTRCSEN